MVQQSVLPNPAVLALPAETHHPDLAPGAVAPAAHNAHAVPRLSL